LGYISSHTNLLGKRFI